jgi:hypothetical protein
MSKNTANKATIEKNVQLNTFNIFVSMPYDSGDDSNRYWTTFYFKAIEPTKKLLEEKTDFRVRLINKKMDTDPGDIHTLVVRSLDAADVLLCVLTDFKANVMFEVGYARKMGIPMVFLLDQHSPQKDIPILLGRPQTMYYDGTRLEVLDTIPGQLWQFLRSACYEAQAKRGLIREVHNPIFTATCYQNRDYLDLPSHIREATSEIEILTTNVDYFAATSEEKVQHPIRMKDLKEAVDRGVKIRIWTMNPDSNIVVERSKLLQPIISDVFQYRKALIKNIKTLYIYFADEIKNGNFYIGIYDALPTLMIYRIDNWYFIPSVSLLKRSRECIHVEFKDTDPGVNFTFETTLEQIRRTAKPITLCSWIHEDWPEPHQIKE